MTFLFYILALSAMYQYSAFLPRNIFQKTNHFYTKNNHVPLSEKTSGHPSNNTQGFYGLIGPNVNFFKATSLIELFTGNGVVQGVFIDNGKLTFVTHIIETTKVKFEKKYWTFPSNMFVLLILGTLRMLPVSQGVANTALIHFANQTLALYENDSPYFLDINFKDTNIYTKNKLSIKGITSFSGHTKKIGDLLETLDYNVFNQQVIVNTLTQGMDIVQTIPVDTAYIPVVHDFISTDKYTIFIDSPLHIQIDKFFEKSMPVSLNSDMPTYIHVVNKITNDVQRFTMSDTIYAFHLINFKETEDAFTFESLQLDELDFSSINFHPKLRKIVIDRRTRSVSNEKNEHLEELDMDFPLKINNTHTLFSLIGPIGFYGFVICKDTKVVKKVIFEDNMTIAGEPQVIVCNETPHLIGFSNQQNIDSVCMINLVDFTSTFTPIPVKMTKGFHSIFIPTQHG